jgi:hypothetical protein
MYTLQELATFDWSTGPGWVKVTVKDNNSGKVIFDANMSEVPIPRPLISKAMRLVSTVMPGCIEAVQLPIDDNTGKTEYADVAAYSVAQKAFSSKPLGKIRTKVCFDVKLGTQKCFVELNRVESRIVCMTVSCYLCGSPAYTTAAR